MGAQGWDGNFDNVVTGTILFDRHFQLIATGIAFGTGRFNTPFADFPRF
jgi:hypothetical protein